MPAAVNVELLTEVLEGHRRALNVPTRSTGTPWTVPGGFTGLDSFPECEVAVISFTRAGIFDSSACTGSYHL